MEYLHTVLSHEYNFSLALGFKYLSEKTEGEDVDNGGEMQDERDEEIEERDPVTDLYPFAIAPSATKTDLFTIYYLLKRNQKMTSSSKMHKSGKDGTRRKRMRK